MSGVPRAVDAARSTTPRARPAARARLRTAALLLVLAGTDPGLAARPARAGELEDLLFLLTARDRAFDAYLLEYDERPLSDLRPAPGSWRASGVFARERGSLAALRYSAWGEGPARWSWAVWNGSRERTVEGLCPSARPCPPTRAREVVLTDRITPGPLAQDVAGALGVAGFGEPWSRFLRRSATRLVTLGRGDVLGRGCLKVLLDAAGTDGGGDGYALPVCVWFDDEETLLALRTQWYTRAPDARGAGAPQSGEVSEPHGDPAALEALGAGWRLLVQTELLAHQRLAAGVHVGTLAQRRYTSADPEHTDAEVALTAQGLARVLDAQAIQAAFDLPLQHPCRVKDLVRGREYSLGAEGQPAGSSADFDYWCLLEALAPAPDGVTRPLVSHPFERSSCGPNALLLAAELAGSPVSLAAVLEALPEQRRTEGATRTSDLSAAAEALGLQVAARSLADPDELEPGTFYLARLADAPGGDRDPEVRHYAVVRRRAGVPPFEVASPPGRLEQLDAETLARSWVGELLRIQPAAGTDAAGGDRSQRGGDR